MEVIIGKSPSCVATKAADMVQQMLAKKPACVLGLATGSTPIAMYQELIQRHRNGDMSFCDVTTFNLDEYLGVAPSSPRS